MTKQPYGTHVYVNEGQDRRTFIYIETKIHCRNVGAIWGNAAIPYTGKRLKCDRRPSENKLHNSVGTSARD